MASKVEKAILISDLVLTLGLPAAERLIKLVGRVRAAHADGDSIQPGEWVEHDVRFNEVLSRLEAFASGEDGEPEVDPTDS